MVKNYLVTNAYPPSMVNKEIKRYLDKVHTKKDTVTGNKRTTYMKLPYIGKFSKFTQSKIKHLCETFCKETYVITLVFSSNKIASFFTIQDKIPSALKFFVVC